MTGDDASPIDVRTRLRTRRREMGISQEEAARRIGASLATYSRWERGKASPNEMSAVAIEREMSIPLSDLLPDQGDEQVRDVRVLGALEEIRQNVSGLSLAVELLLSEKSGGDDSARDAVVEQLRALRERTAAGVVADAFERAAPGGEDDRPAPEAP